MHFSNHNHISKSVVKFVIPQFKKMLEAYHLKKNSFFELWYKEQEKVIEITNYQLMNLEVSKLFNYKTNVINEKYVSIATPKNKKIIKELNLDTIEKLNEYYASFQEEYEKKHLLVLSIPMELYRGLNPDYYDIGEPIYEWDTKENTTKKLKKEMKESEKYLTKLLNT